MQDDVVSFFLLLDFIFFFKSNEIVRMAYNRICVSRQTIGKITRRDMEPTVDRWTIIPSSAGRNSFSLILFQKPIGDEKDFKYSNAYTESYRKKNDL